MLTKACTASAGLYCGLGFAVPVGPTIAGMIGVILVRALLWTKKETLRWNLSVMGLCVAATFFTLESSTVSPFYGFWMGVGYGGLGVGIVKVGQGVMGNALGERFKKAFEALFGIKFGDTPSSPDNQNQG